MIGIEGSGTIPPLPAVSDTEYQQSIVRCPRLRQQYRSPPPPQPKASRRQAPPHALPSRESLLRRECSFPGEHSILRKGSDCRGGGGVVEGTIRSRMPSRPSRVTFHPQIGSVSGMKTCRTSCCASSICPGKDNPVVDALSRGVLETKKTFTHESTERLRAKTIPSANLEILREGQDLRECTTKDCEAYAQGNAHGLCQAYWPPHTTNDKTSSSEEGSHRRVPQTKLGGWRSLDNNQN